MPRSLCILQYLEWWRAWQCKSSTKNERYYLSMCRMANSCLLLGGTYGHKVFFIFGIRTEIVWATMITTEYGMVWCSNIVTNTGYQQAQLLFGQRKLSCLASPWEMKKILLNIPKDIIAMLIRSFQDWHNQIRQRYWISASNTQEKVHCQRL